MAMSLCIGALIWAATANSYESLLAARLVGAIAGAPSEGLASAINSELFFLHERGFWMGLYVGVLNFSGVIGAIMSAFVIQNAGWRWHLRVFEQLALLTIDLQYLRCRNLALVRFLLP
jgi:MFS family permease